MNVKRPITIAMGISIAIAATWMYRSNATNAFPVVSEAGPVEGPPETNEKVLREKLVGSWRIVSASFDGKPSELHRTSITIKHVTPVHVIWIGYQPEDRKLFRSAGGSWTIDKGRYVETMRYGLSENFRQDSFGKSFGFDCRFEGNRWIQSGTMPNGLVLEEIWERIQENEDVDAWPAAK